MEKELNQLVEKLKGAAGTNLRSVVLYGSATTGEFHTKYSDLNVLCVLERLDMAELKKLNQVTAWWTRKRQPPPLVFTLDALRRSADVFPIELLDIKSNRRVLYGEDVFDTLDVPMKLHRVQLERELRANLLKLRQRYLSAPHDSERLLGLMTASISSLAALFRHALLALGEQPPQAKREVVDRLAALLGFDTTAFHTVLDVREGKRREKQVDAGATFAAYLEGLSQVVEEVDQRLKSRS